MMDIHLGKQLKDWKNGEGESNMNLDDEEWKDIKGYERKISSFE